MTINVWTKIAFWSSGIGAVVCVWIASASAIYCAGVHRMDLYKLPFNQWLQILPWWQHSTMTTVWVVTSAAIPTIVLAFAAIIVVRLRFRSERRELYGSSKWASKLEMQNGGVWTDRRPF